MRFFIVSTDEQLRYSLGFGDTRCDRLLSWLIAIKDTAHHHSPIQIITSIMKQIVFTELLLRLQLTVVFVVDYSARLIH